MVAEVAARLHGEDAKQDASLEPAEAELAARLEEALAGQGEVAGALREPVASVQRGVDAVGEVVEAAARDEGLLPGVEAGFAGLGEQFGEFAFMVDDVHTAVWEIEKSLRQQQAVLRVEQERAHEHRLTLARLLEAVERREPAAAGPEGAASGGGHAWAG